MSEASPPPDGSSPKPRRTTSSPSLPTGESSPPADGSPRPRRTTSSSSFPAAKVLSAARAVVPPPPKPTGHLQDRLKDGAADTALNFASVLKERWSEFKSSSRFFKYKVLIIGLWLALSGLSVVVAWPESSMKVDANLGARLVLGEHPERPVFVIMNEGEKPWRDVTVTINGSYRASTPGVDAHQEFALTPKQLVSRFGKAAPPALQATDIVLHTKDGDAVLMRDGELK